MFLESSFCHFVRWFNICIMKVLLLRIKRSYWLHMCLGVYYGNSCGHYPSHSGPHQTPVLVPSVMGNPGFLSFVVWPRHWNPVDRHSGTRPLLSALAPSLTRASLGLQGRWDEKNWWYWMNLQLTRNNQMTMEKLPLPRTNDCYASSGHYISRLGSPRPRIQKPLGENKRNKNACCFPF